MMKMIRPELYFAFFLLFLPVFFEWVAWNAQRSLSYVYLEPINKALASLYYRGPPWVPPGEIKIFVLNFFFYFNLPWSDSWESPICIWRGLGSPALNDTNQLND
jgi:hypothetical protein